MSEGGLVYVPSDVRLYVIDADGLPLKYMKLKKPASLLVTRVNQDTYEVLYEKQLWLVEKNKTYGETT